MKIKELMESLKECDPNAEISVLFPLSNHPNGGTLEPIFDIQPCIDQDTNQTHYVLDTGIGEANRYQAYYSPKNE